MVVALFWQPLRERGSRPNLDLHFDSAGPDAISLTVDLLDESGKPTYTSPVTYLSAGGAFPTRLAGLAGLAAMLAAGMPIKCASLTAVGSYDTHADEPTTLATNLSQTMESVLAFQRDLEARGLDDRVMIQLWSEFGRRPKENGSGTDHGAGSVDCWGLNYFGELGTGSSTGPGTCGGNPCSTTPAPVSGLTNASAVGAHLGEESCAILVGGQLDCWGDNAQGQLGDGTYTGPDSCTGGTACSTAPAPVSVGGTTAQIAVGTDFACAQLSDSSVECWGDNFWGELGNGSTTGSATPVAVSGIGNGG